MEHLVKTFNLSESEKEKLLTANVGEGILLMENEHTEIRSIASKEEHLLITTNPNELLKIDEPESEQAKEEKVTIKESCRQILIDIRPQNLKRNRHF